MGYFQNLFRRNRPAVSLPADITASEFEVEVPEGDGLCSDKECPCGVPGAEIPRGQGYLYVGESVVKFRSDARSVAALRRKIEKLGQKHDDDPILGRMLFRTVIYGPGVHTPILMCELGARRRKLDLRVAAEDAQRWWQTGRVPLRVTPQAR
jgi:hypothetical protein